LKQAAAVLLAFLKRFETDCVTYALLTHKHAQQFTAEKSLKSYSNQRILYKNAYFLIVVDNFFLR